jgi:hypothetical protein
MAFSPAPITAGNTTGPLEMKSEQHMPSDQPGLAMRRILKRLIERENSRASR